MKQQPSIIFIVGNSRSGTTMMSRILGRHPKIFSFNELHFFEHVVPVEQISRTASVCHQTAAFMAEKLLFSQRNGVFMKFEPGKYQAESEVIIGNSATQISPVEIFEKFCKWYASTEGKSIACEQTPKNIYYAKELLEAIPDAVIINMVRDPRDVLLSQKMRWRRRFLGAKNVPWLRETIRSYLNYHPITMAKLWKSSVNAATRLESPRFTTVHFESLLQDPESALKEICEFIGITYDKNMLAIERVGSSNVEDRKGESGIDPSRSGRWSSELSLHEAYICQALTRQEMRRLGYSEIDIHMPGIYWIWYWFTFCIKMGIALMLNISRTRNLYQSYRRRFVAG